MSVLIVEVEGKSGLAACFDPPPLTYEEAELAPAPGPHAHPRRGARRVPRTITVCERISKRLVNSGALEVVATAVPGHEGHPRARQGEAARAAGRRRPHRDRRARGGPRDQFLMSARGLQDAVHVGPVRKQAAEVVELLTDPTRCQVMLVTLPEETPVNELVETAFAIEDRAGVGSARSSSTVLLDDRAVGGSLDDRPRAMPTRLDGVRLATVKPPPSIAAAAFRRAASRRCSTSRSSALAPSSSRSRRSTAVPVHRRCRRATEIDDARRRVRHGIERAGSHTRRRLARSSSSAMWWCAAARAASARPRPRPCSRSKARVGAGAPLSSRSIRPSASPTRSGSTTSPTRRMRSIARIWVPRATRRSRRASHALDARHEVDLRRARCAKYAGDRGSGRADPRQPLLPQHRGSPRRARRSTWRWRSCTSSHEDGVVRPHRRRHAADAPCARLPRRARPSRPACSTTGSSGCCMVPTRVYLRVASVAVTDLPPNGVARRGLRGHRRHRRVLPRVRGYGGGLPDRGRRRAGSARRPLDRVRARHDAGP